MDKKTLPFIIALVVAVIFYWQILEFFGIVDPAEDMHAVTQDSSYQTTDSNSYGQPESTPEVVKPSVLPTAEELTGRVKQTTDIIADTIPIDSITIITGQYRFILSSLGGGPVAIQLRDYTYRDDRPIEMLPVGSEAVPNLIFSDGKFETSKLHFTSNLLAGTYEVTNAPLELIYRYESSNGGVLERVLTFYPDKYSFDLQLRINDNRLFGFERWYETDWNVPLGVTEPNPKTDYDAMEAVAMQSGSRVKLDDYDDDNRLYQVEDGYTSWVGVRAKYFAACIIPEGKVGEAAIGRGRKTEVKTEDDIIEGRTLTAAIKMQLESGSGQDDLYHIFVGPLDYYELTKYDVGLEDMLDIGTTPVIGWIIKPFAVAIIWLLPKLYSIIPNYGFVLIIFAFLMKVVTLPLSMKSFKSMNAMKELQPKIEALKEKHKKDAQKLNQETMKLYKAHGVNPISGCLPMLPQMPLFFALFQVIRSTILLRDAPFIWFVDDLSRGAATFTDPLIILVVLMVLTQFISQKFTMATSTQNKGLMYLMPVFMGWIFHTFASGLVLYWTAFSLFSLMDYMLFKRNKKNEAVKTA